MSARLPATISCKACLTLFGEDVVWGRAAIFVASLEPKSARRPKPSIRIAV